MRRILVLLPAVLIWACADRPTQPEASHHPQPASRSAVEVDDDAVVGTVTTASFDAGHSHADIIVDGTTYDGLKFETDRDWGMYYDSNKGNGGSNCLYDNAVEPGDILWLSVTKSDFGDFRFDSIWIGATAGNTTITARGYLDGVEVEVSEDVDVSFDGSHTFDWSRVDEVRFEAPTDLFSCFDDFTYASYESTDVVGPEDSDADADVTAPVLGVDTDLDGFTVDAGDCDDSNPEIHPGKSELPGNGIDDDCDASTADVAAAGTLITASFDAGHSHADIIADGTTYNGLKFETDHDWGMYYDSNKGNGGSKCLYDNAVDPGDVLWLSITKTDFSDFRFDSIWIGATAGNTTLMVRGYLDGVEVETSEDVDVSFDGSHTFDWGRVDEVRFEAETDLFSCFDDFTYASSEP